MITEVESRVEYKPLSYKTPVPECRTVEQNNEIFRKNKRNGLPFLGINKGRKYGKIEYDFITIDYNLKEEARKRVQELFEEMPMKSKLYKWPRPAKWSTGKVLGISIKVELRICRGYAPLIRDIVFNPDNWELTTWGKIIQAHKEGDYEKMIKLQLGRE